jgi:predicted transcriptional regulator
MATTQGIKLDDKTRDRLKELAEKRNRSPHWIMRTAIENYLDREEVYEREKSEDMARWERYLDTGIAIDHEKVEPWLKKLAQGKDAPWQD